VPSITYQSYGYVPTGWVTLTFMIINIVLVLIHTGQAIQHKYWIVFPTLVTGGIRKSLTPLGPLFLPRLNLDNPHYDTDVPSRDRRLGWPLLEQPGPEYRQSFSYANCNVSRSRRPQHKTSKLTRRRPVLSSPPSSSLHGTIPS
jgi:hypothetical protein